MRTLDDKELEIVSGAQGGLVDPVFLGGIALPPDIRDRILNIANIAAGTVNISGSIAPNAIPTGITVGALLWEDC